MDDPAVAYVLSLLGGPWAAWPAGEGERVLGLVRLHRLEGAAVVHHRGAGPSLPEAVLRELEPEYRKVALWTTLLLESAERAREALGSAGIPSLLLKGAALLRDGVYHDPGARRMDDVDLLVPTPKAGEAVRALAEAGFEPWTPWRPETVRWLDSASFHDPAGPPGMPLALDLHWRTGYGRLRFGGGGGRSGPSTVEDEVGPRSGTVPWEDADPERGVPAPHVHFALLAEHLLKHLRFKAHLHGLADLVLMSRRVESWERVEELAGASPLASGMGHLLVALREELGAEVPAPVGDRLAGGGRLARSAAPYVRPSRLVGRESPVGSRVEGLLLRCRLLGTPRRIGRDLLDVVFPGRPWLRARYGRVSDNRSGGAVTLWLRYVADALRWARAGGPSPASPNQDLSERSVSRHPSGERTSER